MIWKTGSYVMFTEDVRSSGILLIPAFSRCEVIRCTESHITVKIPGKGYHGGFPDQEIKLRNCKTKRKILPYKESKLAKVLFSNEPAKFNADYRKANK